MFRVGIAEKDITPANALRVAGMLNPPLVEQARWRLFARAFFFESEQRRTALVVLDNLFLATPLVAGFRAKVTHGLSIAPDNVMVACTHTHRAPFAAALMDEEIDFDYVDFMTDRAAGALREAEANLRAASCRVSHIDAPGWTFNRRQLYRSDRYGEQVGTQGPQAIPEFLGNEGPEDDELKVIQFVGEDRQSLGGLVNFACHTTVMGGEPVYSADYAGVLTEALAHQMGGIFGFLQGASGNLWAIDTRSLTTLLDKDFLGPDHAIRMAGALQVKAQTALDAGRLTRPDRAAAAQRVLEIPQRRVTREQVALGRWYLESAQEPVDQKEFTRKIHGHDYTFFNNDPTVQEWFARDTIGMWEWQRRAGTRELIEQVEVQVMIIGDVALVGLPGEIFTEFGLEIKSQSPFQETLIVELANGWHGYIPTRVAFQHGGYETRLGYTSRLVPEAGEQMVEAALGLLSHLFETI